MYPAPFRYHAPRSLDEAIRLLAEHGDEAKILAGGHSLLPAMRLRLAQPKVLVDIGRVPDLSGIRLDGGTLVIGAMTTHREIERSSAVKERCPLLAEVAPHIGDVQVRHRGTIGGSLAHADPASDWPAAILALDAGLKVIGPNGERTIPARDFFVDVLTTALAPDEVLAEIRIPRPGRAGAYEKARNRASGFAVVGVAVAAEQQDGKVASIGIGITGAAGRPARAEAAEQVLLGRPASPDTLSEAAAQAAVGLDCTPDLHASAEYRRHLVQILTRRALSRALGV
ncbi:MAG: xanthine dehydrogenase family protein subunit M [Chloroflexi bacterium]|nr:xanthine dehydrogenase family protein subunit M [Chloroflexota bacterium]